MPNTQLINDPTDISLNEEQHIQQILGNPPNWILKWGILLIFCGVLVMLAVSYFVKYPDKVSARVIITTQNPPIRVISKTGGKITQLKAIDQGNIQEGEVLAVMESTAELAHIEKLEQHLSSFSSTRMTTWNIPSHLQLGKLQVSYAMLLTKIQDLKHYNSNDITLQKAQAIQAEIKDITLLNQSLEKQRNTMKKEGQLLTNNHARYQQMFKDGNASKVEVEQKEAVCLQHQRQIESMQTSIINNNIRKEQLETQILELKKNTADATATKQLSIQEDVNKLLENIKEWKQNYLVTAPISGTISFPFPLYSNQFIAPQQEMLIIIPDSIDNGIKTQAIVPMAEAGKIKKGMNAQIQVDGFPMEEYGTLASNVAQISLMPNKGKESSTYLIELALSDSLSTSYQKEIPFRQEMEGSAEIYTQEKRVLERLFSQLMKLVKRT